MYNIIPSFQWYNPLKIEISVLVIGEAISCQRIGR